MGGSISRMAKRTLLATIRDRCQALSKEERSRILDEFTGGCRPLPQGWYQAAAQSEDGFGKVGAAKRWRMLRRGGPCLRHYQTTSPCSLPRLQFPVSPYPSTCWMVQRLTSRRLASSRWLTPLDRSSLMCSRCCSVSIGRRPGKRPSVRAFA